MAYQIIRDDITKVSADAIVNIANAGAETGQVTVTPASNLDAKFLIHTVGPTWIDGNHGEREVVRRCYAESLKKAKELGCESIAFPLIATDVSGFSKGEALQTAISVFREFLSEEDMSILLVVFDNEEFVPSGGVFDDLDAYIENNYVSEKNVEEHHSFREYYRKSSAPETESLLGFTTRDADSSESLMSLMRVDPNCRGLDDWISKYSQTYETWQECLFRLIDEKGFDDVKVYKDANVDRKLFSKIKSNREYVPKKTTVIAFAVALKLNLEETMDFLNRAGYALSPNNWSDLIVQYFIECGEHDIDKINVELFARGLPCLGGRVKAKNVAF